MQVIYCRYQLLGPGRIITRQGHHPERIYLLASGEVCIFHSEIDKAKGGMTTPNYTRVFLYNGVNIVQ